MEACGTSDTDNNTLYTINTLHNKRAPHATVTNTYMYVDLYTYTNMYVDLYTYANMYVDLYAYMNMHVAIRICI